MRSHLAFLQRMLPAIKAGNVEVVRGLIDESPEWARQGCDPDDGGGEALLHRAALEGQPAICGLFLDHGVPVDVVADDDDSFSTPLGAAATRGHLATVRFLLAQGASVDGTPRTRVTALLYASTFGHAEVVSALLDAGAEVNRLRLGEPRTALDMADMFGHAAVGALLRAAGGVRTTGERPDWSQEHGGSILSFVDGAVGPVLPIRLAQVVPGQQVDLRIARIGGKDRWRLLFTVGLFVLRPRVELALCLPAEWPLHDLAAMAGGPLSFPIRLLHRLASRVSDGDTLREGSTIDAAMNVVPEAVWPDGLQALVAVDHSFGVADRQHGPPPLDDVSVTILVLAPLHGKPPSATAHEAWLKKQRRASWHRLALRPPAAHV